MVVRFLWFLPLRSRFLSASPRRDPYPPWRSVLRHRLDGMRGWSSGSPRPSRFRSRISGRAALSRTTLDPVSDLRRNSRDCARAAGMMLPALFALARGSRTRAPTQREEREARAESGRTRRSLGWKSSPERTDEPDHLDPPSAAPTRTATPAPGREFGLAGDPDLCRGISGGYERLRRD